MAEKKVEEYYTRPPKLGACESFKLFIYNSETGQVLGRTGSSWAKILLFYLIFYAGLVAFFAAMLVVFFQTLDLKTPKWQLDGSIIGDNPGLGFRPMPPEENVESTLIWYKGTSEENYKYWTNELDKFLKDYRRPGATPGSGSKKVLCDFNNYPGDGNVCDVDVMKFGPCISQNFYGYHKHSPCIFLKLNKIYAWVPEVYKDSENLPKLMPEDLKEHIKGLKARNSTEINTIWVSCEGENPADQENIGPIQYNPMRGFPAYFFPFKNSDGYMSPLVAVYFESPTPGVLINIECKAWAHNIHHDRMERRGSVHFELMVD